MKLLFVCVTLFEIKCAFLLFFRLFQTFQHLTFQSFGVDLRNHLFRFSEFLSMQINIEKSTQRFLILFDGQTFQIEFDCFFQFVLLLFDESDVTVHDLQLRGSFHHEVVVDDFGFVEEVPFEEIPGQGPKLRVCDSPSLSRFLCSFFDFDSVGIIHSEHWQICSCS